MARTQAQSETHGVVETLDPVWNQVRYGGRCGRPERIVP